MTKEADLKKKIHELEEELRLVKDENASLWLMLDEIKKSEIAEFEKELTEAYQEAVLLALTKNKKPSDA